MYLLIEDKNHLRHKKLKVGAQIVLPLLYEICEQTQKNELVQPLDSVSKLKERIGNAYRPVARQFRSGNLNLIYPWEQTGLGAGDPLL